MCVGVLSPQGLRYALYRVLSKVDEVRVSSSTSASINDLVIRRCVIGNSYTWLGLEKGAMPSATGKERKGKEKQNKTKQNKKKKNILLCGTVEGHGKSRVGSCDLVRASRFSRFLAMGQRVLGFGFGIGAGFSGSGFGCVWYCG